MRAILALACVLLCVGSAQAGNIVLNNWDIETNSTAEFGAIDYWGPNGGWADHAGFSKPNNGTLGSYFGYYSAQSTETVGQITSEIITANTIYDFWSWAMGGGNDTGTVPYEIGYAATNDDLSSFVLLAVNEISVGGTWAETAGVSYTTGGTGAEIGKQLIVRLGTGTTGSPDDIWFDSLQANKTPVPEPGTLALLGVGLLSLLATRRRK
jgi:hypothetical protein